MLSKRCVFSFILIYRRVVLSIREKMTQNDIDNPVFKAALLLLIGISSISFFVVETVGKACITIILNTTTALSRSR